MYHKLFTERKNEINTLSQKIKYDKLTYYFKSENRKTISFNDFNRSLDLKGKIMKVLQN